MNLTPSVVNMVTILPEGWNTGSIGSIEKMLSHMVKFPQSLSFFAGIISLVKRKQNKPHQKNTTVPPRPKTHKNHFPLIQDLKAFSTVFLNFLINREFY